MKRKNRYCLLTFLLCLSFAARAGTEKKQDVAEGPAQRDRLVAPSNYVAVTVHKPAGDDLPPAAPVRRIASAWNATDLLQSRLSEGGQPAYTAPRLLRLDNEEYLPQPTIPLDIGDFGDEEGDDASWGWLADRVLEAEQEDARILEEQQHADVFSQTEGVFGLSVEPEDALTEESGINGLPALGEGFDMFQDFTPKRDASEGLLSETEQEEEWTSPWKISGSRDSSASPVERFPLMEESKEVRRQEDRMSRFQ